MRGGVLVGMVVVYAATAAACLPPDMGKGPLAEMRYVVPLVAVGCAVGGVALALLWKTLWPAALPVFVLLAATNWLHLGCMVPRFDGRDATWPGTLYRYLDEMQHPYEAGNESLVALLGRLPAGTTVRVWPSFMVYPPMYYVPGLHYCDQLTERKAVRRS